ncbi:hypothetical protein BCR44DRAFT_294472 [Catenaria anguillulae PL171]|uniref:USP domain-containing protein n=1 Tax=Catenaria anguillulae PL171 TaxID=765915 RepID=A0A1Y2I4U4_9FUNG|nr:hypothetical protein BCR44DRAFT_294472 [Catenaria anguillulae PL171]
MDVDEFYNQLFDRLESEMKGTPQVDMLDHRYGGRLVHMIESNECGHISTREEPYHALQCEVKGRQTLEESLAHYVQGESLSGDNKYRCSTCNNLVDAVKSTHVGTLPTNLIFHLKRFEFDMEFFHRIKINDRFEFPPTIDMRPYLTPAGRAATPGSAADPGETKYDLTGVLVHMGTSESGHYYSFIRDAETLEWFQFNDTIVSPFQVDHLPEEAFGGGKANSAYMLVYRRRGTADDPATEQAAAKAAIPKDTLEAIYETNAELRSNLCLFDRPLGELVLNLGQFDLTSWIVPVAAYYVRVALRGTDRTLLTQISSLIADSITQPLADWFLGYFVAIPRPWAAIAHNVIDATSPDIRANVVNTLSAVVRHRASDLAVRQFASVLSHTFVEVDLRLWWRTCDQICVLALAVLDRVPNAFEKNIAKLISTVTGDWDRQSKTNIMAISKANLRPINVLILRAVFNADSMDVPSLLFVSNDRHACLYFVQLAVYCHEWVDLLEPLTAIAKKFGVAGSMYIGLVGAIKYIQTPEAHQFLRQAFKAITSVSTPKDRELAIGWLKWVVESEAKELSEMAGITIVLVLYMLAGCEETLPVVRVTANVWMLLRASPSPLVKGYVTQFLQVIGVLAPNPPAPAGR